MKHIGRMGLIILAAGGFAACFRDPLGSLASGSQTLVADRHGVVISSGKSAVVTASLRDGRGQLVPLADATWRVADTTLATVAVDTAALPGSYESRATVVGRTPAGGVTTLRVTAAGLSAAVVVAVLPSKLDTSFIRYAGALHPDTSGAGPFSAPDTLIVRGTALLRLDTVYGNWPYVRTPGRTYAYVLTGTASQLKMVFIQPAVGRLVVHNLLFATGDSVLGTIRLDSLVSDSVAVSRQRFTGPVTTVGDTLVLTAAPGTAFSTPVFAPAQTFILDTFALAPIRITNTRAYLLSPLTDTGYVTVDGMIALASGAANVQLGPIATVGPHGINAATFPGPIQTGGRLLDTITVRATANTKFWYYYDVSVPATYPCGECRYEVLWILQTPDSLKFVAPVAVNGPLLIGVPGAYPYFGVLVGDGAMPMYTRDTLVVSGTVTGEPNEPGNDSAGGATPLTDLGGGAAPVFGALNSTTDTSDYYTITFTTPKSVAVYLDWIGNGSGDAADPAFDVVMCDSLVGGACGAANDLLQGAGSRPLQGQQGRVSRVPPGQVWFRVVARSAFAGNVAYRLEVLYSTLAASRPVASP